MAMFENKPISLVNCPCYFCGPEIGWNGEHPIFQQQEQQHQQEQQQQMPQDDMQMEVEQIVEILVDNSIVLDPSGGSNESINNADVEVDQENVLAIVPAQQ